jgi:hypothetical protein
MTEQHLAVQGSLSEKGNFSIFRSSRQWVVKQEKHYVSTSKINS